MLSGLHRRNRSQTLTRALATFALLVMPATAADLPKDFVRLSAIAPQIEQDIRYFGSHNFVGRPIAGYEAGECILTRQAAEALLAVAQDLEPEGLGLKIYDCYRPAKAVADFAAWANDPNAGKTAITITINTDGTPALSYTGPNGANGICNPAPGFELGTPGAAMIPMFNAECPSGLSVHADEHGPIFLNDDEGAFKSFSEEYFEASSSGTTVSVSLNESGVADVS